jgi:hypothetical protein
MGYHYVPQFYLRGFETDGRIWAYDKKSARRFPTQVKSVANETGMYSDDLESFLANEVEGPANLAITKVRGQEQLSTDERLALAKYIVVLWKRVPKARDRALNQMPKVADEVHATLRAELDQMELANPEIGEQLQPLRAQIAQIISKHQQNPAPELWYESLQSETGPRVVDALLSMRWTFLCGDNVQFLTCDNPVFFFAHEGIGKPTSEVTFPLSSSMALWASRIPGAAFEYQTVSPSGLREINRRTAYNASRFVYAARDESWILPFITKERWTLTRLR